MKDDLFNALPAAPSSPIRKERERKSKQGAPSGAIKTRAIEVLENALAPYNKQLKGLVKSDPKAVVEAFRQFEKAVGGRLELAEILKQCPVNSTGHHMALQLAHDPDFLALAINAEDEASIKYSLDAICQKKKVSLPALVAAFKDAKVAQLAINSLLAVSDHVQPVMEQVASDAQNHWAECRFCRGNGRIQRIGDNAEFAVDADGNPITQLCYECRGSGEVYVSHDFSNRKLLLDFVGLVKKEPLVQQNFDQRSVSITGGTGQGGVENVMKSLDALFRGVKPTETIDVEVVDVQSESHS